MTEESTMVAKAPRLARLLGFLEADPDNLRLIADAAAAAFDAGELGTAERLLARHRAIAALSPALVNLEGLVALRGGRYEAAAEAFTLLLAISPGDGGLRFNLAWSRAMLGDHAAVVALVDDDVVRAVPRAAALKVEALHHLDRMDEALAVGEHFAAILPEDRDLAGALAVAAMDDDNIDLARFHAERSGNSAGGLATLGALTLGEHDPEAALAMFDQALASRSSHPRALLGKGLALLAMGDSRAATSWVDRGAEEFGDHLGSWIAAGWTHYIAGDHVAARARFDHALLLDETFAESHGALAVLDIAAGRIDEARKRTEIALRLDRSCFAGALAKSLLLAHDGDPDKAARVRDLAMNLPVGPAGETLAQAAAAMGMGGGKRGR